MDLNTACAALCICVLDCSAAQHPADICVATLNIMPAANVCDPVWCAVVHYMCADVGTYE